MLRTGKDIKAEYENSDDLKRMRHSYLAHILDYISHDRQRVFDNDMILLQERNKDRVTLQNVFDIAEEKESKKQVRKAVNESSDEEEDMAEVQDDEEGEAEMSEDEEK